MQDLPYQVRYLANINQVISPGVFTDSSINITNSGAQGAGLQSGTNAGLTGTLCANIYVFAPDEQLVSCCSCPVTPNGLVSLSARNDLVNNTLTITPPTSVAVKILASVPTPAVLGGAAANCTNSAADPLGTNGLSITPATAPLGLVAWATTVHRGPTAGLGTNSGPFTLTETQFSPSYLSDAGAPAANVGELNRLRRQCMFILANGSGFGVCTACRFGGLGAGRL